MKRKHEKSGISKRAEEVRRLNMLEGVYPETFRRGQPDNALIAKREQGLREKQ